MRDIKYIIIHCTASPQTQTIEAIQNYWEKVLKWKTPGYHYIIKPDGNAVQLQSIEKPSNGVAGFNANAINLSYIGGVEVLKSVDSKGKPIDVIGKAVDNRTPEQIETMIDLVKGFKASFPKAQIKGHRDFSPDKNRDGIISADEWMKTCPSFSVTDWLHCVGIENEVVETKKTITALNFRKSPGGELIKTLPKGTPVEVILDKDNWSNVKLSDGSKGWVATAYLI